MPWSPTLYPHSCLAVPSPSATPPQTLALGFGSVAVQGGSEVVDEGIRGVVSEARALSAAAGCPRGRGAPVVEDLAP
jgi:hypothetical protein